MYSKKGFGIVQISGFGKRVSDIITSGLVHFISIYQWFSKRSISRCRFYPSCSEYTKVAILRYGSMEGICMGIARILKCHPFHRGGVDFVPERKKQ